MTVALRVAIVFHRSSKGDIYTDVQLETSTGAVKLSELLAVHTVVLLQFFSLQTDEAVCGAAAERVGGLIEQYGAMGLQCLVVSLTGQAEVREFSRKHRLPESAQAWDGDSQKASQVYGVRFLPHTVVIDKAGEVTARPPHFPHGLPCSPLLPSWALQSVSSQLHSSFHHPGAPQCPIIGMPCHAMPCHAIIQVLHNGSEDCDIVVHFALHRAWMENIRNLLRVQKELSGLKSTFEAPPLHAVPCMLPHPDVVPNPPTRTPCLPLCLSSPPVPLEKVRQSGWHQSSGSHETQVRAADGQGQAGL